MNSLNKCNGSSKAINDLSTKVYISSKTKDVSLKVFIMITIRNKAKMLVKHISCD